MRSFSKLIGETELLTSSTKDEPSINNITNSSNAQSTREELLQQFLRRQLNLGDEHKISLLKLIEKGKYNIVIWKSLYSPYLRPEDKISMLRQAITSENTEVIKFIIDNNKKQQGVFLSNILEQITLYSTYISKVESFALLFNYYQETNPKQPHYRLACAIKNIQQGDALLFNPSNELQAEQNKLPADLIKIMAIYCTFFDRNETIKNFPFIKKTLAEFDYSEIQAPESLINFLNDAISRKDCLAIYTTSLYIHTYSIAVDLDDISPFDDTLQKKLHNEIFVHLSATKEEIWEMLKNGRNFNSLKQEYDQLIASRNDNPTETIMQGGFSITLYDILPLSCPLYISLPDVFEIAGYEFYPDEIQELRQYHAALNYLKNAPRPSNQEHKIEKQQDQEEGHSFQLIISNNTEKENCSSINGIN